jgi:general secretion pathway protein D
MHIRTKESLWGIMLLAALANLARAAGDEVLPLRTNAPLGTVTYAVADLVVPVEMEPSEKKAQPTTREADLMQLLRTTVAPQSWSEKGGPASMQYFPLGMGLVVVQTAERHEQIKAMLNDLRRLQDIEIAVNIRLVSLTDDAKEKFQAVTSNKDSQGHYRLTESQLQDFMKYVQQDRSSNVMQAPKLTVFNGQRAKIAITDQQNFLTRINVSREAGKYSFQSASETVVLGQSFSVRPVLSDDKRTVSLNLGVYLANLESSAVPLVPVTTQDADQKPLTNFVQLPKVNKIEVEKTLKIADGETVIISLGCKVTESRTERGPPIVSKIPYMNRLFTNTAFGRESTNLYLLVTPQVIRSEAETNVAIRK